jgi:hypothetical protein
MRPRDIENLEKGLLELLTAHAIIEDAQVTPHHFGLGQHRPGRHGEMRHPMRSLKWASCARSSAHASLSVR